VKNILSKFYLFSKLSFSLSLLFILILLGYLFYRSYSSLSISENDEVLQNNNLQNSINLNSSKIEKIELLLSENNLKLNNIFNVLDKKNENIDSNNILKEIQNDFINIKTELKNIQIELQNNKIAKEQLPKSNIDKINITNIAQLIKLKFENGKDYSTELELFSNILGNEDIHIAEKLYIINNNKFLGSEFLISNFKKETNDYISANFIKKNKLIEIILPYLEIQPSKSKKLSDSRLIVIGNILTQLEKKKYSEAVQSIKSIDENNNFFNSTIQQLSIVIEFENTLEDFISHG
tara:strand:- start:46 stop:924 length:879 start_codon:yes stop_codon:yes gene_type:complete